MNVLHDITLDETQLVNIGVLWWQSGEINQVIFNAIIDQSHFTQGLAKLTGILLA